MKPFKYIDMHDILLLVRSSTEEMDRYLRRNGSSARVSGLAYFPLCPSVAHHHDVVPKTHGEGGKNEWRLSHHPLTSNLHQPLLMIYNTDALIQRESGLPYILGLAIFSAPACAGYGPIIKTQVMLTPPSRPRYKSTISAVPYAIRPTPQALPRSWRCFSSSRHCRTT